MWRKKKESPVFKVDFATCQVCPAGQQGGLCQHVFALLMVIEEYRPREAVPTLPTAEPVTSIRRSWGPRERNVEPCPIFQSVLEKAKGEERKGKAVSSQLHDCRGTATRENSGNDLDTFRSLLPKTSRLLTSRTAMTQPKAAYVYGEAPEGSWVTY